jgi:molybdopterin molybdotransferase
LNAILSKAKPLPGRVIPLERALGLSLAADVRAPHPYPLFDNAALDGYALRSADTAAARAGLALSLQVQGAQFAGKLWRGRLGRGQALHVTTGAPMPKGADALVPYEAVRREGPTLWLQRPALKGQNLRRKGEDGARGHLLASAGTRLTARHLALLAAFGVRQVKARPQPRVAVAVSGDELLRPGQALKRGRIFDSNSPALRALLTEAGLELEALLHLPDQRSSQTRLLQGLLKRCDVLLVAGSMSVGERDLGKGVLESLGVRRVFWKVAQKPGKPLYFGQRGRQLVLGLPGNPAAVISCFAAYVLPALRALSGQAHKGAVQLRLAHALAATGDKALFLKAQVEGEGPRSRVRVLGGQGSHLLHSLAQGNALVARPAGQGALRKGALVQVLPL